MAHNIGFLGSISLLNADARAGLMHTTKSGPVAVDEIDSLVHILSYMNVELLLSALIAIHCCRFAMSAREVRLRLRAQ